MIFLSTKICSVIPLLHSEENRTGKVKNEAMTATNMEILEQVYLIWRDSKTISAIVQWSFRKTAKGEHRKSASRERVKDEDNKQDDVFTDEPQLWRQNKILFLFFQEAFALIKLPLRLL